MVVSSNGRLPYTHFDIQLTNHSFFLIPIVSQSTSLGGLLSNNKLYQSLISKQQRLSKRHIEVIEETPGGQLSSTVHFFPVMYVCVRVVSSVTSIQTMIRKRKEGVTQAIGWMKEGE